MNDFIGCHITDIQAVRKKIHDAAVRSNRNPEDVLLLGVTKTVDPELMQVAFDCGIKDFGENRVQEYIRKADILNRDCNWHIIGRMQTNKVKYLDNRIALIHSLDRLELAQVLQERGNKHGIHWNVLMRSMFPVKTPKPELNPKSCRSLLERSPKWVIFTSRAS
jgi:uncharacterized pyridoxal phosphate-containing UPF0001 family protein